MCDKDCICKSCINGGCGACNYAIGIDILSQCHHTGIKKCRFYKKNTWFRRFARSIREEVKSWNLHKARKMQ
jgi:hypothetical protein